MVRFAKKYGKMFAATALAAALMAGGTGSLEAQAATNGTILQGFEWYLKADGTHWNTIANKAKAIGSTGFTAVWLPPAYKGSSSSDVGYGVYDLYDLGEFDQKGTVRTKYGTKDQYLAAIKALQNNGVQVYADIVLNHKASADGTETVNAVPVQYGNRNYTNGNARNISAWSVFNFSGRGNKYSSFKWNASCFNGVDYDNNTGSNQVFRFSNKNWDWEVDNENGNYDYLMYADIDFDCDYVVDELKNWGEWYVEFANLDGFRLDAVKHIKFDFYKDWLTTVRSRTGKELFAVGEYWSPDVNKLNNYINVTGGTTSLFDVPLHMNFYNASNSSGNYDMRKIADGTLVASNPVKAVTFVDNHDTQAGQSLQSPVMYWFRPLAYSYILTREQGYPCVFYPDYYGYADGQASHKAVLDKLMEARTKYAYGKQRDYFDHKDVIGWTREGDSSHANSGLAALITDGPGGSKKMYVGTSHAGEVWKDITGNVSGTVTIGSDGYGTFSVDGGSTSVWVYSSAGTATVLTSSRSVTSSASAAQTLSLASTTASTTTYTSSNSSVKVSSKGKVTIPKNFAGKVTITVKKKNKVTEKITINVKPAKATLSSVTNKSGKKLQVKWKKLSYVTGYEIRYSNSSSFKSGNKTVKITKASTVSKTITGLTKGKTYYVKVRAYKQDGKTTINGSWSTAKKIKITK